MLCQKFELSVSWLYAPVSHTQRQQYIDLWPWPLTLTFAILFYNVCYLRHSTCFTIPLSLKFVSGMTNYRIGPHRTTSNCIGPHRNHTGPHRTASDHIGTTQDHIEPYGTASDLTEHLDLEIARFVGRLGSAIWVSASFQKHCPPCASVSVSTPPHGLDRVRSTG